MYYTAKSLDDLMRQVLNRLLKSKNRVKPARGDNAEETGVLLKLSNPRMRISRSETKGTAFSTLGELLWYLSGSNKLQFILYYIPNYDENSDDGETIYGAYGPRLFHLKRGKKRIDQIQNVVRLLKDPKQQHSRRAVIQLFDGEDISSKRLKDIPCTCTLQFLRRKNRLHLFACMRSNDAYLGLPHDVFAFTMLQEIVARKLGIEIGEYKHFAGSLHLYAKDFPKAQKFLDEGWHESKPMPPMPLADPSLALKELLACEEALRLQRRLPRRRYTLQPYWADLVRLLKVHRYTKEGKTDRIAEIRKSMSSSYFNIYIQKRQRRNISKPAAEQLGLSLEMKNGTPSRS